MSEFAKDLKDEEDSDEPTDKGRGWARPPLVPRSLELNRRPLEAAPPPPMFERFVGKGKSEEEKKKDDTDDDSGEARSETAVVEVTSESDEFAPVEAAEATEVSAPEEQQGEQLEAIMEQMGSEYAEATPGDTLSELGVLQVSHEPEREAPELFSAATENEDEEAPQTSSASAGGSVPPLPPPPVTPAAQGPNQGPAFNRQSNWNAAPTTPNTYVPPVITAPERRAETEEEERRLALRRGLVAGFITGWVVHELVVGRKQKKQIKEQNRQIAGLEKETKELNNRLFTQAEESRRNYERLAQAQTAEEQKTQQIQEELFDQEGNRIILQPGWRVERSSGGYSVVLDEHNRVVHDAIRYGEAYKHDQKREQINDDLLAAFGGSAPAGGHQDDTGFMPQPNPDQPADLPQLPMPQAQPDASNDHRAPERRNQVVVAATSPWVWTAIALLIIIYFIAALA